MKLGVNRSWKNVERRKENTVKNFITVVNTMKQHDQDEHLKHKTHLSLLSEEETSSHLLSVCVFYRYFL